MREIKFRAWDIVDKLMISIEELMWDYDDRGIYVVNGCGTRWLEDGTGKPNHILNDGFILMQFTGLLDKDGKEIYEGDIVKDLELDNHALAKIVWGSPKYPYPGFMLSYFPPHMGEWAPFNPDEIEVIGNIYENPELLEEKK